MEAFLASNPYFSAGFGLIGVGAGLSLLRTGSIHAVDLIRRRMLVSVEISSKDPAYSWFLAWVASTAAAAQEQRSSSLLARMLLNRNNLSLETTFRPAFATLNKSTSINDSGSDSGSRKRSPAQFSLIPAPGRHMLKHNSTYLLVDRTRQQSMLDLKTGTPWESVTITTLARDRGVLLEILEDAKTRALEEVDGKTVVYVSYGHEWRPFGAPRAKRPLESVVLDTGVREAVVGDLERFLAATAWYRDRGIPYRRGYLLYGPPGTGKTSFIQAVAGHLSYNICILNLSERGMTDDRLAHLLANTPPQSLLLLEDIDAAFIRRDAATDSKKEGFYSAVTFSGLLNALDGVAAAEERVVFMTTNHVDRLDAALIRPGRVDMRVYMGNARDDQARRMFERFYPQAAEGLAERFVSALRSAKRASESNGSDGSALGCSPAALQGHFTMFRDSAEDAVAHAKRVAGDEASTAMAAAGDDA
ncbi:hypothetical protein HDU82_006822 [Entophlyctis luteolus]|nr:hypothetical protein HDU82_006822 [Entophlyctis luteolus]KAJ3380220.1 hypothetical protein HDU84_006075 [Entophlyctis sp. JEL0112]